MSSEVRRTLKQLSRDELLRLAKKKGAKVSNNITKSKLVDILSPFVSQREILDLFGGGGRGLKAVIEGAAFEKKAMAYFTRRGFSCELNHVQIKGMEFDIVGERTKGTIFKNTEYILAECKNKPKVIMQDFDKFLGKYNHFVKRYGLDEDTCQGYIISSGVFDNVVKSSARIHSEITLIRI